MSAPSDRTLGPGHATDDEPAMDSDSDDEPAMDSDSGDEPTAQGDYQLRSTIDLTVEAVLPQQAADVVVTMRDFSIDPAHTLIQLAEDAGVPAVGTIKAALPSALETRLEGWINGEIAKVRIAGVPVTTFAANVAALAESTLTTVALDSTLTIASGTATHRLSALDFAPAGVDARLDLDAFPGEIITATTTAATTGGTITLGDHQFSIEYGRYAWEAVNGTLVAGYGAGVRDLLGSAISCPAIAATIANKCVLGVCVGHKTELTELCERGLDEVVDRAYEKVSAIRFDALHLASGEATMTDTTGDRNADRLVDGVWTAEINAGQGLRHVPATFSGER
ncbi:MAG: hypothetical protein AB7P03_29460 [Kofleriaceae bacterium]